MSDPVIKKRKPLLAALLSLLAPGLGQLYNGQWTMSLIIMIAAEILIAVDGRLLVATYPGLLSTYCLNAAFNLSFAIDAYRSATKAGEFAPRPCNRVGYYAAFVILAGTLSLANGWMVRAFAYEMFSAPTASMAPTIEKDDRFMVAKHIGENIRRNDILVFRSPYDGKTLVKRCIALGHDTVEIRHKQLWINGKQTVEPFTQHSDITEIPLPHDALMDASPRGSWEHGRFTQVYWARDNFGPVVVPENCLFMMGDNRDDSYDSRFLGPVPRSAVVGKPLYVYFSRDFKRIGTTLR
ncbi:MAG TPA: signal peptidase I [Candidatus Edwardsbacteria bacterium]|nr:signal peptidase I [Candidatus Edwardsbacteria bacterium]